jgi:hypothetical protein
MKNEASNLKIAQRIEKRPTNLKLKSIGRFLSVGDIKALAF